MGKEGGRFGDLVHDEADDLFLVFDTMAVASRISVSFSCKGESASAVYIVVAWVEHAVRVIVPRK